MNTQYFSSSKPRVFAHRGFSGNFPENTVLSFQKAVEAGADILEMDVHATSDGQIVVLHDPRLDRTTDGGGCISDLTWAQVEQLDAGFRFTPDEGKTFPFRGKGIRIPSLREVAERFARIPFNIEIKQSDPAIEREVFELLRETGHAEMALLAAETDSLIERIRTLDPGLPTNFASSEVLEFLQRAYLGQWQGYHPLGRALQIPEQYYDMPVLTEKFLASAHGLGIEVHVWTINEEADMRRLLKMGVDGVISDYPGRLREVIEDLSLRAYPTS